MKNYQIPQLPLSQDIETKAVLKQAAKAHRRLAELKGVALTIPNEQILISTLTLQEAKDSSAIENIVTTYDEIFKAELYIENLRSPRWSNWRLFTISSRAFTLFMMATAAQAASSIFFTWLPKISLICPFCI